MRKPVSAVLLLFASVCALGQGSTVLFPPLTGPNGVSVPFATLTFCTTPTGFDSLGNCLATVSVFQDQGLTTPYSSAIQTDGLGNFPPNTVTTTALWFSPAVNLCFTATGANLLHTVNVCTPFSVSITPGSSPSFAALTLSNFLKLTETTAPTCALGFDFIWGDSADHRLKGCNNNGTGSDLALLADFASPPAIGNTTPAAGAFTAITVPENTAPSGVAGKDVCYGDSTAHALECSYNNLAFGAVPLINRAQTWTATQTFTGPVINGSPTGTGIPTVTLKTGSGGGNYITSSTTYVRVDSTNLAFTVTVPTGWKLVIAASGGGFTATAVAAWFVALADGSADNTGIIIESPSISTSIGASAGWAINYVLTGDGASHTINLQYRTSVGADAATIQNNTSTIKPTMTFLLTPSN